MGFYSWDHRNLYNLVRLFFNEHYFTVWNGYSWWPSLQGIVKTKIPPLSLGCVLQLWAILRESINYHMSPLRENRVVRTNTRSGILGWEDTLKSPRENVWGECRTLSGAARAKQFHDAFLKYLCLVNCPHCAIFQDWHMGRRWVYISAWKFVTRRLAVRHAVRSGNLPLVTLDITSIICLHLCK